MVPQPGSFPPCSCAAGTVARQRARREHRLRLPRSHGVRDVRRYVNHDRSPPFLGHALFRLFPHLLPLSRSAVQRLAGVRVVALDPHRVPTRCSTAASPAEWHGVISLDCTQSHVTCTLPLPPPRRHVQNPTAGWSWRDSSLMSFVQRRQLSSH